MQELNVGAGTNQGAIPISMCIAGAVDRLNLTLYQLGHETVRFGDLPVNASYEAPQLDCCAQTLTSGETTKTCVPSLNGLQDWATLVSDSCAIYSDILKRQDRQDRI